MSMPSVPRSLYFSFLLLPVLASAQTTVTTGGGTTNQIPKFTSGSQIGNSVITESNGSVGIGTSTPAATLDVNGSIRSSGASGFIFSSNPYVWLMENYGLNVGLGGDDAPFSANFVTQSGNSVMKVRADGRVGIGTGDPGAWLDLYRKGNISGGGAPSLWIGNGTAYGSADDTAVNGMIGFRGAGWKNGFISYYPHKSDGNNYFELSGASSSYGDYPAGLFTARLGIGVSLPTAKLEVNGNVKLTAGSGASITFPDNSVQSTAWNGTTCGGDYAESVDVEGGSKAYEPGDVLVIDKKVRGHFSRSAEPYSKRVAGIYSTKPGLTGRRQTTSKDADSEVPMAMMGIVPVKVSAENGAIEPGDLLVASSKPGYAMKGTDSTKMMGAVIGKAMDSFAAGAGVIEALVSLQ